MGERLNGIQEVGSSILPGSTNLPNARMKPADRKIGGFVVARRFAALRGKQGGSG
jgi:hypothetical protein